MNQNNNEIALPDTISDDEISTVISKLKSGVCNLHNIPDKYLDDERLIKAEKELGIRRVTKRGYDIISNYFFVVEELKAYESSCGGEEEFIEFDDFDSYYDYLEGDIYDNSCYFQCDVSKITKKVDINKLMKAKSFIDYTIDDFKPAPSDEEKLLFEEGEAIKEQIKEQINKWIEKLTKCKNLTMLKRTITLYSKSEICGKYNVSTYSMLWMYIACNASNPDCLDLVMQYVSSLNYFREYWILEPLYGVYGFEKIVEKYVNPKWRRQEKSRERSKLRKYLEWINNYKTPSYYGTKASFDTKTHYYCERDYFKIYRYFESFDELLEYFNNDLSGADLSGALNLNYDFTKFKTDENTKLPVYDVCSLKHVIQKRYFDNKFIVLQSWYTDNDVLLREYRHEFDFFFDFVAFLEGNLTEADLLLCDGLKNLKDVSGIDFTGTDLTSEVCDKLGIKYTPIKLNTDNIHSFKVSVENEKNTEIVLQEKRELATIDEENEAALTNYGEFDRRVFYISDLHILHKLKRSSVKSESDIYVVVRELINTILDSLSGYAFNRYILINGDVSSDFSFFRLFVELLRKELDLRHDHHEIVFTLGNHELWDFSGISFREIVKEYRDLLRENGMWLLQNEILFEKSDGSISIITEEKLNGKNRIDKAEIRALFRTARMIILGGLAFSGCNKDFNANNGIYRSTISRKTEIGESLLFEEIYNYVLDCLPDKKLIVMTHTPIEDWHSTPKYYPGYIYVSGHTHKNVFHDDGEVRIYADNQVGYSRKTASLKFFYIDQRYDYFADYKDGIHVISKEDYKEFYYGKKISIDFNMKIDKIYMLKKNGVYCFIANAAKGKLKILNGGASKLLKYKEVEYYFDNMDKEVARIKNPLDKYTKIQEKISKAIKRVGGDGRIHGCIIDIDFYNHVYVNPEDLKVTAYYALDIGKKWVYPSVPSLLEDKCPEMYENYIRLLESKSVKPLVVKNFSETDSAPIYYPDTDIYNASLQLNRMQRLNSNILSVWYEPLTSEEKDKIEKRYIRKMKREEREKKKLPVRKNTNNKKSSTQMKTEENNLSHPKRMRSTPTSASELTAVLSKVLLEESK